MDLARLTFIKESNLEDLKNNKYLENLIIKLGFNTENLREQPKIVKDNGGGLLDPWAFETGTLCRFLNASHSLKAYESYNPAAYGWSNGFKRSCEV